MFTPTLTPLFSWEAIGSFGSLREWDQFRTWMRDQVADAVAEEIKPPADVEPGERWFRHIATGTLWRLVPVENPYGPGFWPVYDETASPADLSHVAIVAQDEPNVNNSPRKSH
jgi:hypothetical protein